jgi:hypothetical protein
MIAYNPHYISNLKLLQKTKQWFPLRLLTYKQYKQTEAKYTVMFYSPNTFVKIGLFIFTLLALLGVLGLYMLLFGQLVSSGNEFIFATFTSVLFAIGCFTVLEKLIKTKQLYNSGVDEALLYAALSFVCAGICFVLYNNNNNYYYNDYSNTLLTMLCLFLPFVIFASIRYIDTLTTLVSVSVVYTISFLLIMKLGAFTTVIMPFALMLLSAVIYYVAHLQLQNKALILWHTIIHTCRGAAMLVFYVVGNYFVVRECSITYFNTPLNEGDDIPLAIVFYVFTAIVPIAYIYYGLIKKDKLPLWIGLLLVAAAALTFKYYFSLGHPEISLTVAGIVLISSAYAAIRYLKTDKHGITFNEELNDDTLLKTNMEALTIVQGFSTTQTPAKDTFGGGDFGGAGAGANF